MKMQIYYNTFWVILRSIKFLPNRPDSIMNFIWSLVLGPFTNEATSRICIKPSPSPLIIKGSSLCMAFPPNKPPAAGLVNRPNLLSRAVRLGEGTSRPGCLKLLLAAGKGLGINSGLMESLEPFLIRVGPLKDTEAAIEAIQKNTIIRYFILESYTAVF